jgi:hypothetical protein
MPDITVANPEAAADGPAGAVPAITETADRARTRRRSLILATALSVAAAVLATMLATVLTRRSALPSAAPRPAPTSTINVNWGLALFGTNVMGEQRRRGARLRDRLPRRR